MPADITLRRLAGLHTDGPDVEGDTDQLIRAENVIFDNNGLAMARQGLHFREVAPAGENDLVFMGVYALPSADLRIFVTEESYYTWDGVTLTKRGVITVSSGLRGGGTTTLNIPSGHPFAVGDSIRVDVATASADGVFTVSAVGATTVSYVNPGIDEGTGAGTVTLRPRNTSDRGVQYAGKIYFADGKHMDGTDLHNTPGQLSAQHAAMCIHSDRMWFIRRDTQDSRLRFSEPGNPESWPAANFLDVGPDTGIYPRGLRSFQNKLFIFRDSDTWLLETPGIPTTWVLRRFLEISADANGHIEYDGAMYWSALTGVYRFDGSAVEQISDPIQDIFFKRSSSDLYGIPYSAYIAGYRDVLYMGLPIHNSFYGPDDPFLRILCYHIKLGLWSEIVTPLNDESTSQIYRSLWAEEMGEGGAVEGLNSGIYMTFFSLTAAFIVGTHDQANILPPDYWGDQAEAGTTQDYDVVIQTKYGDFGDPYNMKRCLDWVIEYMGGTVDLEQIDERGASVNTEFVGPVRSPAIPFTGGSRTATLTTLTGLPVGHPIRKGDFIIIDAADSTYDYPNGMIVHSVGDTTVSHTDFQGIDASNGSGTVVLLPNRKVSYMNRARGIGYFRRMSLKLTVSDFRDVGFKLLGLYGRMRARGKPVRPEEHSPS